MPSGSKLVVYAALAGNLAIAVTKLAAASYTGSGAMFTEAVHSFVDTGNQGLLLTGCGVRPGRPTTATISGTGWNCISGPSSSRC